jgi:cardiolipin synthase
MTVPNVITVIRILLIPLLIYLLLENRIGEALLVFFIAGFTDGLDGFIARVFHQKSRLGAYLDPLADKLLLGSSFVLLAYLGLVPVWLAFVTLLRDALILFGFGLLAAFQIPLEIKPVFSSKLNTLVQIVTVLVSMSAPYLGRPVWGHSALFVVTAVICVFSGFRYLFLGVHLWRIHRPNKGPGQ